MKSINDYISEEYNGGSSFPKEIKQLGFSAWKRWEKENKKNYNIIYDEYMQCYFVYTKGDKPGYIMQHIATYNAKDDVFYWEPKDINISLKDFE